MKTLIFILMLLPLIGSSQNIVLRNGIQKVPKQQIEYAGFDMFQVWKSYLSECNELVPDTIIQSGIVNVEYKPVMSDGRISHFILAPIDTVWQKIKCRDFKYDNNIIFWNGGNVGIGTTTLHVAGSIYTDNNIAYSTPEAKSKITITRKKICQIKKRKASWEDFWNRWCKEKKIIEFN